MTDVDTVISDLFIWSIWKAVLLWIKGGMGDFKIRTDDRISSGRADRDGHCRAYQNRVAAASDHRDRRTDYGEAIVGYPSLRSIILAVKTPAS